MPSTDTPKAATDKQVAFLRKLVAERYEAEAPEHAALAAWLGGKPTSRVASSMITKLLDLAPLPKAEPPKATSGLAVPGGHYALRIGADGPDPEAGHIEFYVVRVPTEGKWAEYTFLDIQASDDTYPIKDKARKAKVLAAIAADTLGAMQLYGQELGSCGRCNRTLTDDTSRARGIGPVCWAYLHGGAEGTDAE